MIRWWKDLPVAQKLYAVVGLMAVLIAAELLTLVFAINTLSALRALVNGEGLWTKAQKDAIQSLYRYTIDGNEIHYENFRRNLEIPYGDRLAREELMSPDPRPELLRSGLLRGANHPDDIEKIIRLLIRFRSNSYLREAIESWEAGDRGIERLVQLASELHSIIRLHGRTSLQSRLILERIAEHNESLTELEIAFSSALGKGSRWLEKVLLFVLSVAVLTVAGMGLLLTYFFSRHLNQTLSDLKTITTDVAKGNLSRRAIPRSADELGQLTLALNEMIQSLEASITERIQSEAALRRAEFERHQAHIRLQKLNEDLESRVAKRTDELREARDAANIANATKSEFLANMSHEIRTPLGAILGFSEILLNDEVSSTERAVGVEVIRRNGQLLFNVINDILDLSKVEAGKLSIERIEVPFSTFISEMGTLLSLKAAEKGVTFAIDAADPEIPDVISTDPLRLRQVLANICGNAIKFTESGGSVQVRVRVHKHNNSRHLAFIVRDTGTGISESQVQKLFVPFTQADASTTRKFGGTGLGLVLSKKLAQALGGDVILAESQLGLGSTFVVTIDPGALNPASFATASSSSTQDLQMDAQQAQRCALQFSNLRILIVDDSFDNQLIATHFLKKTGAHTETANNGKDAIEMAKESRFDIILMDLQMPVMDGFEALRELRGSGYKNPIIALTAHAMNEERKRCLESGFTEHLSKPIDRLKLYDLIARFTCSPAPTTPMSSAENMMDPAPLSQ